uniref:G-protein coupled receptors family 1 profile domain-containing protein n=1 Tax=Ciona savignyi TaxID=51511 RepID=H2Z6F5_CIOSA
MIGVYALIFMTGIMGHCCVISYFACGRRCRPSSFSAHLVLSNLTICQLLYLLTCLPASAYKAIIGLTSKEWIFGDIACKMVPFL